MTASFTPPELRHLLLTLLARELKVLPDAIDPGTPLTQYGVDSIAAVIVASELEDTLSVEIPSTLLWDCPTVNALVNSMHSLLQAQGMESGAPVCCTAE
jgi:acyl carrier protein